MLSKSTIRTNRGSLLQFARQMLAAFAFYAKPLTDVISAVVSTIAFLMIIDRHLKKWEQVVIQ